MCSQFCYLFFFPVFMCAAMLASDLKKTGKDGKKRKHVSHCNVVSHKSATLSTSL